MKKKTESKTLLQIIGERRSVRRYDGTDVPADAIRSAARVLDLAPGRGGERCWRFIILRDDKERGRLIDAALGSLKGKINSWLAAKGIPAMIAACADPGSGAGAGPKPAGRLRDKRFYLSDTSIAMELLVLAAREGGLGTCWIGAFEEGPVRRALGVGKDMRVVAISPLGHPYKKPPALTDLAAQYDRYTEQTLHKRRLPLRDIVYLNKYGDRLELPFRDDVFRSAKSGKAGTGEVIQTLAGSMKFADSFSERRPKREQLAWIFEAARLAPSANNSQPWRFILVDDRKQREALESATCDEDGMPAPLSQAPVVIAAAAETPLVPVSKHEQPYFMIDIPIAISHILLMAAELGIAANVLFDFSERRVRRVLKIPDRSRVVALISLGHPAEKGEKFPLEYFAAKPAKKHTFEIR
ncbi:MAG: nitroreductase family protein [bacterium]